jgi:aspartate kinase
MRLVFKFGGVSVSDGEKVRKVAGIVQRFHGEGNQLVVVVSAMQGVTNSLVDAAVHAGKGKKDHPRKFVEELAQRHVKAVDAAIADKAVAERTKETIQARCQELRDILLGVAHIGELTPRSRDYIVGFGEKLSAPILQGAIEDMGMKSKALTGGEAGILTDDHFGSAQPLMNVTTMHVRQTIEPMLEEDFVVVIGGFTASTQEGVQTTLGRGGSDFTASLIGASIRADEVWVWKDVDGLMTANPKFVKAARMIETISFAEAMELAHFGAEVIHPKALECAGRFQLPFRVKSLEDPDRQGSLIVSEVKVKSGDVVKAITNIDDVDLITVSGASMVGTPRLAAKVLQILTDEDIDVLMISQSSSEESITLAIPKEFGSTAQNALELALLGSKQVREVSIEAGLSIIAVVGAGMKGIPGVAARVFGTMAQDGINIRAIAQGSSELNISFIVKKQDARKAVEALHGHFRLGE